MLPPSPAPTHAPPDPTAEPPSPLIEVEVSDTQTHLAIPDGAIEGLVARVLRLEGFTRASISIAVVDDAAIHELNRQHLNHDWPTDVITFPLSDEGDEELSGELIVSAEMAKATAAQAGVDPWHELALYIVHGLLHLAGFDDLDLETAAAMRRREDEVLTALGLTNTFARVEAAAQEDAR